MRPQKPYLGSLDPDATRISVVLEWMRHLGETFGTAGAVEALGYYERRGWITADAREQLAGYLRGLSLTEPKYKTARRPVPEAMAASLSAGPFGTHAQSLEYVAAIADGVDPAALRSSMSDRRSASEGGRAVPVRPASSTGGTTTTSDRYTFSGSDD